MLAALCTWSVLCTSCIYFRLVYYNVPDLGANAHFAQHEVRPSTQPLRLGRGEPATAISIRSSKTATFRNFDEMLEANHTRAFVVLRNDTIVYERYFGGFDEATLLPSFSISKTFAALLVGCALDEGLLSSVHESIVMHVPELAKRSGYPGITLDHLLRMTSGIDFDEESTAGALLYYATDLRSWTNHYRVRWPPGRAYAYGSINVQLLWEALHHRLGDRTVSAYFQQRVWEPLGAEFSASWSLDSTTHGVEKLFGGFNAVARDYAKLGLFFLHGGRFQERRVVSQRWIEESLAVDPVPGIVRTTDGAVRRGKYQWFLTLDGRAFFAKGYRGQYIFVVPASKVVVVRFGEGYGDVDWPAMFLELVDAL